MKQVYIVFVIDLTLYCTVYIFYSWQDRYMADTTYYDNLHSPNGMLGSSIIPNRLD
jgi:hypothetical protein